MADPELIAPPAQLILASASPRRRELLAALGLPFTVIAADIDEGIAADESPAEAAIRLARSKAETVARDLKQGHILGADTIVVLDGRILGKPLDANEATHMLRALRDRDHRVITGVALCDVESGRCCSAAPMTSVRMRNYPDAEIAASIAAGTPFDKAGAYAIQDAALSPVARIDGCYCNVVGLPLWTVFHLLSETSDVQPAQPSATRVTCRECPLAPLPPTPPYGMGRGAQTDDG
jgi:septum formation protein